MAIYFVTARELGRVKIGFSAEPLRRFVKMQTDSPVPLAIERLIDDGDLETEAALHLMFESDRLRGEWFTLSRQIEDCMEALPAPVLPATGFAGRPMRFAATAIGDLRRELGLSLEDFARRVGMASKGQCSMIERGERPPSLLTALRIEELSGGRIDAAAINEDVRLARHGLPDTAETEGSSPGKGGEISQDREGVAA